MGQSDSKTQRLAIDPVVENAEEIVKRVQNELPEHQGLDSAAQGVVRAVREAQSVSRRLRRPWGLHRFPVFFLAITLIVFGNWIYWRFLHVKTLVIALPERDAIELHERVLNARRIKIKEKRTVGSGESLELLKSGQVDLAFIQGGVEIPATLPQLMIPQSEALLYFVRARTSSPADIRLLMTSEEGQGSHSVARKFAELWRIDEQVQYLHDWRKLTSDKNYQVPDEVDAVFVIKDLENELTYVGIRRLYDAGFRLASPPIGSRALSLDYLAPLDIPVGYLESNPSLPKTPVATYSVATYLVARQSLTPRLFAEAGHLLDKKTNTLEELGFEPSLSQAKDIFEAIEAFLSILAYLGLAFLTLLGIEIATYRRRFNELNTLISLISMHQSDKDVLGLQDVERRKKNLLYLGICSDLLGIISVITGYYSQENPSLLYNRLTEIIYQRSNSLKLNIQLKILQANILVEESRPPAASPPESSSPADEQIPGEQIPGQIPGGVTGISDDRPGDTGKRIATKDTNRTKDQSGNG